MIDHDPTLPQLEHRPFLTDSGLETALIYIHGIELPEFAAFVLLESTEGRRRLRHYFESHSAIAREAGCGFIAESPTWRANPDWGRKLGYDPPALDAINARRSRCSPTCAIARTATRRLRDQRLHRSARRRL